MIKKKKKKEKKGKRNLKSSTDEGKQVNSGVSKPLWFLLFKACYEDQPHLPPPVTQEPVGDRDTKAPPWNFWTGSCCYQENLGDSCARYSFCGFGTVSSQGWNLETVPP